jgi:hypothetical protein
VKITCGVEEGQIHSELSYAYPKRDVLAEMEERARV